jgi:hypothetical protein
MLIYQFLPLKFALLNLSNQRLKISTFASLNDPFELFPMNTADQPFRMKLKNGLKEIVPNFGLMCFSKKWNCPVQWAHYADRHEGVCLGFYVPENHRSIFKDVRYVKRKLSLNLATPEIVLERALYTKYSQWSYEAEVRAIIQIDERDPDGNHYLNFRDNLVLKKVIVGSKCRVSLEQLKSTVELFENNIEVFKVRPAFTKFAMVKDHLDPVTKNWNKAQV